MATIQEIPERIEVAIGLGHLLPIDQEVLGMDPEARERLAGGALRLGDLVLVVRELQVHASGVNVEGLAQVLHRHGRALQVPAGPPRAERALPRRLSLAAGLPEHEVARIVLAVLVGVHARADENAPRFQPRQLAVRRQTGNPEVGRAVHLISMAGLGDALDEADHLRYVVGGRRHELRPFEPQLGAVLEERLHVLRGVFSDRNAGGRGGGNDLVLDVRDVHHVAQPPTAVADVPPQDVLEGKRPEVADVDVVVDRGPARVHADGGAIRRRECLLGAGQAVVELEGHGLSAGIAIVPGGRRMP